MIKRRSGTHAVKAAQSARMNAAIDAAAQRTNADAQALRRYHYLLTYYARKHHTETDGTSQWYVNSPYLGKAGTTYATIEEAIDAEMVAHGWQD